MQAPDSGIDLFHEDPSQVASIPYNASLILDYVLFGGRCGPGRIDLP